MDLNKILGRYKFAWNRRYKQLLGEPPWAGDRHKLLNSVISRYKIANGTALDIGCGYGDKSIYLSNIGFDTYGIDISDTAINEARKRNTKVKFIQADIRDLGKINFSEDTNLKFDFVLDLFTSHFLSNKDKTHYIKALAKLIKDKGYLVLNVYARESDIPSDIERALSPKEVEELYGKYFRIKERQRRKAKRASGNYTDLYILQKI